MPFNRLGVIVVPNNGSQNNKATATPFSIPFSCSRILVVIDSLAQGYNFRIGTGSSLAATSTDFNQVGPASIQFTVSTGTGVEQVLAIFTSGTGGNATVYQADGPLQS